MPNCQKCGRRWSWSQTLKVNFKFDGMECPNCGKKQYVAAKSKKSLKWISYLPVILILLLLFDFTLQITIGLIIVASILMIGLYPFLIKLTSEDEGVY
ncbi:TIGR04104 family putative zinc finger protein [Oceanobacillus arenosus]|nr:TIGR04104 family putative zinc finger protein [Oceanobacillus arenosus]